MKKLLLLLLISLNFSAYASIWDYISPYLTVSSESINETGNKTTLINNFSIDFNKLTLANNNVLKTIDVYLKSNRYNNVYMTISGENQIKNGDESMEIELTYNGRSITLGKEFKLLNRGEGDRDGGKIGTIEVIINAVSPVQLVGEYNINLEMKVKTPWIGQSTQTFPIKATVPIVTVAGFSSTQTEMGANTFLGATVDFGNFNFNQKNSVDKNLFIRSNSPNTFYISFDTDKLIHESDANYKIAMQYYWNGKAYRKNSKIETLSGVNEGRNSLGIMTFETERINGSLIAGRYGATVNVTITVE